MDNKEAVKILKKGYPDITKYAASEYEQYYDDVRDYDEALNHSIKALEEKEADRWIPVSERLPDKEGDYLVDRKERRLSIQHFFFSIADHSPYWSGDCKVYAWKPLPKPYESEEENDC